LLLLSGKVAYLVHSLLHRHLEPLQLAGDLCETRGLLRQGGQLLHLHKAR
jgi:hypothetical protein